MHLIACRSCCCTVAARFSFLFIFVALFLCTFSALSPVRPCFYAAATDVAWYGIKWYGMVWDGVVTATWSSACICLSSVVSSHVSGQVANRPRSLFPILSLSAETLSAIYAYF